MLVNTVENCGLLSRTIVRVGPTCRIGCFEGTKEEAIKAIKKKYGVSEKGEDYLTSLDNLFATGREIEDVSKEVEDIKLLVIKKI